MGSLKVHGGHVTPEKFNALVDHVLSNSINKGLGYTLVRTKTGTVIKAKPGGATGSSCPFDVSLATTETPGTLSATLRPGSVNELLPTNIFDGFDVSSTGLFFVKLLVTSDGEKITSSEVEIDGDEPEPQTPTPFALPSSLELLVAVIEDGTEFRTMSCGSVTLSGHEEFVTDKSPPAEPGESTVTPWYVWRRE
jgi:hypothetical protein